MCIYIYIYIMEDVRERYIYVYTHTYTYNGILLSHKKNEIMPSAAANMDGPGGYTK